MAGRILILRPTSLSEFAERCEFPHDLIVVILSNNNDGKQNQKNDISYMRTIAELGTILVGQKMGT